MMMAATGLLFAACDDFEMPNPPAQSNPQETIFQSNGIAISQVAQSLDLTAISVSDAPAPVITATLTDFPANYTLSMVMEISATEDFTSVGDVPTVTAASESDPSVVTISVDADSLQGVYYSTITRDPRQNNIYARFAAYAVNGTAKVRIGDPTLYYGPIEIAVTPFASDLQLEDSYSLAWSVGGAPFTAANSVKFTHSSKSVYDDPSFSVVHDFTADEVAEGVTWMIVPASSIAAGGTLTGYSAGEMYTDDTNGILEKGATPAELSVSGPVMFNINMESLDFEYFEAVPSFYLPGDGNGWTFDHPALWTSDYVHYTGYAYLDGEFKFSSTPAWDGHDFGQSDNFTFTQAEGADYYVGTGEADGGNNIKVSPSGVYWIEFNYATREVKMTQCAEYGLIGGFNGWGSTEPLTQSASNKLIYTGKVKMSKGDEWKFRANNDWTINLGGDLTNLTPGGDNFKCEADGTYDITLDLYNYPYTATVVKE